MLAQGMKKIYNRFALRNLTYFPRKNHKIASVKGILIRDTHRDLRGSLGNPLGHGTTCCSKTAQLEQYKHQSRLGNPEGVCYQTRVNPWRAQDYEFQQQMKARK